MLIQENYNLKGHNSLRLDVKCRYFCAVNSESELQEAISLASARNLSILVLGGGTNIVLTGHYPGLVIHPRMAGIEVTGCDVSAGAGENWHRLVRWILDQGLSGVENLSLIPGSVGAAPVQNIGAYGQELSGVFTSLDAVHLRTGECCEFSRADCRFGYRNSVFRSEMKDEWAITRVRLRLTNVFKPVLDYADVRREVEGLDTIDAIALSDTIIRIRQEKLPDPEKVGNVGSFFKNPLVSGTVLDRLKRTWPDIPSQVAGDDQYKLYAAWLIEAAGLKGEGEGGAMVSPQHSLVITNTGNATGKEVFHLSRRIQRLVREKFGISLETEPVIC